jgi:ribonuclease J
LVLRVKSLLELEPVDRSGIVHDTVILVKRQQPAEDGVVTVAAAVNWEGESRSPNQIHLRVAALNGEILLQRFGWKVKSN